MDRDRTLTDRDRTARAPHVEPHWAALVPDHDWSVYEPVLRAAGARGMQYAVGGGFAFSAYAARWRDTKDLDLYVVRDDLPRFRALLGELAFTDYYGVEPYDRGWIYRGHRAGLVVDLIWAMANHHVLVDRHWLMRGPEVQLRGLTLRLIPPEELIWAKMFVVQRDRCDWPDILNILYSRAATLDWAWMLKRLGRDAPVCGGVLSLFRWLCPAQATRVPEWVWRRLGLDPPEPTGEGCTRAHLLDRREWFGPSGERADV